MTHRKKRWKRCWCSLKPSVLEHQMCTLSLQTDSEWKWPEETNGFHARTWIHVKHNLKTKRDLKAHEKHQLRSAWCEVVSINLRLSQSQSTVPSHTGRWKTINCYRLLILSKSCGLLSMHDNSRPEKASARSHNTATWISVDQAVTILAQISTHQCGQDGSGTQIPRLCRLVQFWRGVQQHVDRIRQVSAPNWHPWFCLLCGFRERSVHMHTFLFYDPLRARRFCLRWDLPSIQVDKREVFVHFVQVYQNRIVRDGEKRNTLLRHVRKNIYFTCCQDWFWFAEEKWKNILQSFYFWKKHGLYWLLTLPTRQEKEPKQDRKHLGDLSANKLSKSLTLWTSSVSWSSRYRDVYKLFNDKFTSMFWFIKNSSYIAGSLADLLQRRLGLVNPVVSVSPGPTQVSKRQDWSQARHAHRSSTLVWKNWSWIFESSLSKKKKPSNWLETLSWQDESVDSQDGEDEVEQFFQKSDSLPKFDKILFLDVLPFLTRRNVSSPQNMNEQELPQFCFDKNRHFFFGLSTSTFCMSFLMLLRGWLCFILFGLWLVFQSCCFAVSTRRLKRSVFAILLQEIFARALSSLTHGGRMLVVHRSDVLNTLPLFSVATSNTGLCFCWKKQQAGEDSLSSLPLFLCSKLSCCAPQGNFNCQSSFNLNSNTNSK